MGHQKMPNTSVHAQTHSMHAYVNQKNGFAARLKAALKCSAEEVSQSRTRRRVPRTESTYRHAVLQLQGEGDTEDGAGLPRRALQPPGATDRHL